MTRVTRWSRLSWTSGLRFTAQLHGIGRKWCNTCMSWDATLCQRAWHAVPHCMLQLSKAGVTCSSGCCVKCNSRYSPLSLLVVRTYLCTYIVCDIAPPKSSTCLSRQLPPFLVPSGLPDPTFHKYSDSGTTSSILSALPAAGEVLRGGSLTTDSSTLLH